MAEATLPGIRACVFDAYGTLFDYAGAAADCADVLGDTGESLTQLWRDKQIQYTWLRTVQGRHADFRQVTGEALDFALETLGVSDTGLRERLMNLYAHLRTFPDAPAALRQVKASGLKTAILSNGTPDMLDAAVQNAGIADSFDHVLSVEEIGIYKPHPTVYQLAVDRLGVAKEAIAFVSSNGWDAYAAAAFGFRVVWCNRRRQAAERLPGQPDRVIGSLAELPALLAG